jgi:ABC-2 type transport system permease protein
MFAREVSILIRKEWRQLLRNRSAMLSALVFPFLFLVIIPGTQLIAASFASKTGAPVQPPTGVKLPPALAQLQQDPRAIMRVFLAPFIGMAGLVVPSITATHSLLMERESKTIELMIALPVRVSHILLAKLLAILVLAGGMTLALFSVDAVLILTLRVGSVWYVGSLLLLLLSALAYSTTSALLVSLLAKDYRTATNINGLLLGPLILVSIGISILVVPPALAALTLALLLLTGAIVTGVVAMRVITFERLVR